MTKHGWVQIFASMTFVVAVLTVPPGHAQVTGSHAQAASPQHALKPDYSLAARFMPAQMRQLVFSTSVRPHWFSDSDRFWFSYKTTQGTNYYVVDPAAKTRRLLWNNTKLAEQLTLLTGIAHDAQHLDIVNPELVDRDTAIRFYVRIRSDAVLPGTENPKQPQVLEISKTKHAGKQSDEKASGKSAITKTTHKAGYSPSHKRTRKLYFRYTLATGQLKRLDEYKRPKQPMWASISPNGKVVLFARGDNLYMMDAANYAKALKKPDDKTIVETQLTTDGVAKDSYARTLGPEKLSQLKKEDKKDAKNPEGMRRPPIGISWSQDGSKFALVRDDDRKVDDLWVIHNLAHPRPTLQKYAYPMPGEQHVGVREVEIFTLATRKHIVIPQGKFPLVEPTIRLASAPLTGAQRARWAQLSAQKNMRASRSLWLAPGSDKLYFVIRDRDFRSADAGFIDTATGKITILVRQTSNQWLDTSANPFFGSTSLRLLDHGRELVWWSERDGWAHYYLYSAATGKLINPITTGPWMSGGIVGIDQGAGVLYFMGNGRKTGSGAGIDPYYEHLYRVNLNGSGLTDLTPGDFSDRAVASPDAHYFVVTASRVNTAPTSVLLNGHGTTLAKLAHTDVSRLMAAGYKYPIPFKVKAADGITDLYGVMYEPFNIKPDHKYPVIEYVYPGPQTEAVPTTFDPSPADNLPLAQLGFIVILVGNRGGSPLRDKWYDTYGYGNSRDYGLADKRQAVTELAEKYPFIDATKVGIWGHSGGGFMTVAAMLQYPTFYTAGWAESGNYDNNIYGQYWSEKYDGVREQRQADGTIKFIYSIEKDDTLAANLQGHLMLTTGDMDNNVTMANTMQVANALIHANKRFQMLVFPGMRHSYRPIASYVLVRRMDFFAHWLLGAPPAGANMLLLQNERQHTPSKRFQE